MPIAFTKRSSGLDQSAHRTVAHHDPLHRGQTSETARTARVELVGTDADLGAETVFVATVETRRRIDHHPTRMDLAHEATRVRQTPGYDTVGIVRAVGLGGVGRQIGRRSVWTTVPTAPL